MKKQQVLVIVFLISLSNTCFAKDFYFGVSIAQSFNSEVNIEDKSKKNNLFTSPISGDSLGFDIGTKLGFFSFGAELLWSDTSRPTASSTLYYQNNSAHFKLGLFSNSLFRPFLLIGTSYTKVDLKDDYKFEETFQSSGWGVSFFPNFLNENAALTFKQIKSVNGKLNEVKSVVEISIYKWK